MSSIDDDDFDVGSNVGSRYPLHDCCEFEDAESLRRLIFVRREDSGDDSSSASSSSSTGGNESSSSSSDGNDSHEAAQRAALGHPSRFTGKEFGHTSKTEDSVSAEMKMGPKPPEKENEKEVVLDSKESTKDEDETNHSSHLDKVPKMQSVEGSKKPNGSSIVRVESCASMPPNTAKENCKSTILSSDGIVTQTPGVISGTDTVVNASDTMETSQGDIKKMTDNANKPTDIKGAVGQLKVNFSEDATHKDPDRDDGTTGVQLLAQEAESSRTVKSSFEMDASPTESETIRMEQTLEETTICKTIAVVGNPGQPVIGSLNDVLSNLPNVSDVPHHPEKGPKKKKAKKHQKEPKYFCPHDLNKRDDDENTPLHVAIHARKIEHVKLLLQAGASVHRKCDGSAPIHLATSLGSIAYHAEFAYDCVALLRDHESDLSMRDDSFQTPLYLACVCNLPNIVKLLLSDDSGMATLNWRADRVGGRALHAAAKFDFPNRMGPRAGVGSDRRPRIYHPPHGGLMHGGHNQHSGLNRLQSPISSRGANGGGILSSMRDQSVELDNATVTQLLLSVPSIEIDPQNNYGRTPLHTACMRGNWPVVRLLLEKGANPNIRDRRNFTPGQMGIKRGMAIPNDLVGTLGSGGILSDGPGPTRDLIMDPDGKTLILCHELCSRHMSCPPITRGNQSVSADPPPENVRRLHVLLNKQVGILRSTEFDKCVWDHETRRAAIADVLKIHEYSYIESISRLCSALPDHPNGIASLDPDTSVSRWSFEASLRAAGSVCQAVDKVMAGDFRNAFCPVRPPGHHAGPRGIVTCPNDTEGSHGFCLLNNVAIGAAYARSMYRNDGITRVAIIDFDVHHGNGTEEIVRQLIPSVEHAALRTKFAVGSLQTSQYRPWLDESDVNDVFFASTHGWGPRDRLMGSHPPQGGWFYPASGKTFTSDAIQSPANMESPNLTDFLHTQTWTRMGEESRNNCCKIINVGLSLPSQHDTPGMQRVDLRDSYRKEILPYLVDFDPDIIFISAGFDAHKRDTMNFGYVGMVEDDYEWITEQLVKVANTCCNGRIISVLEGGYKIHGGIVSPFARSVASHVRALVDGSSSRELYDKQEGDWESEFERHLVERKERNRQLRLERLSRQSGIIQKQQHTPGPSHHDDLDALMKEPISEHYLKGPSDVGHSDGNAEREEDFPTRKRRRNQVDYRVLFEEMKKEGEAG